MATLENLPEDVVIEILSRLPPESLLRFKSVRKSWYALINHPKFVTKHLSNSLHHNHVLLKRLVTNSSGEKENIFSILNVPFSVNDLSESFLDIHFPYVEYFNFCGHSHGLICLFYEEEIFLWNPTTREIRKLPPSILHLTEPPEDLESATDAVGFGFDPKSKDFKVVRMVYFVQGPGFGLLPRRVEIYDLSKDRWREIVSPVCGRVIWSPLFEIYHQGIYYWWAHNEKEEWGYEEEEIIQTFDMSEEVFDRILMPEEFNKELRFQCRFLTVLNGWIVLFSYPNGVDEKTFHVWEMEKDECGGVSWSKFFTIGPVSGIKEPMLFVSFEELLMEATEGQLVLYNIRTQYFTELPIKGAPVSRIEKSHTDWVLMFFRIEKSLCVLELPKGES